VDTSCASLGAVVGRSEQPVAREDAPKSAFTCTRNGKTRLECSFVAQDGARFLGTGKGAPVVFESLTDNGVRFNLVASSAALYVLVDRNTQAYVLAQRSVDESTGMVILKQCLGSYYAGTQVDRALEKFGKE
jgi:hypothetical protein